MQIKLHKNARTTLAIREQIKNSVPVKSINYLAKKFNLSWNTVARWKKSNSLEDKSSRRNPSHFLWITLTKSCKTMV